MSPLMWPPHYYIYPMTQYSFPSTRQIQKYPLKDLSRRPNRGWAQRYFPANPAPESILPLLLDSDRWALAALCTNLAGCQAECSLPFSPSTGGTHLRVLVDPVGYRGVRLCYYNSAQLPI